MLGVCVCVLRMCGLRMCVICVCWCALCVCALCVRIADAKNGACGYRLGWKEDG